MKYYAVSSFVEQKLRQNTETVCGKTKWTPIASKERDNKVSAAAEVLHTLTCFIVLRTVVHGWRNLNLICTHGSRVDMYRMIRTVYSKVIDHSRKDPIVQTQTQCVFTAGEALQHDAIVSAVIIFSGKQSWLELSAGMCCAMEKLHFVLSVGSLNSVKAFLEERQVDQHRESNRSDKKRAEPVKLCRTLTAEA